VGIAGATVATSLLNCVTLLIILHRRTGALHAGGLVRTLAGALAAAVLMGGVVFYLHDAVLAALAPRLHLKLAQGLAIGATMAAGAAVYGLLMALFCRQALDELRDDFRHRKARKRG
jgi:peptidoglycan biosynthesis protein MviN/MurJ (putative lipid II flippase)